MPRQLPEGPLRRKIGNEDQSGKDSQLLDNDRRAGHTLKSWAISRTRRWKGSFRMRSSVDFWYLLISRRATVPGLNLWGFLTPPVAV